MTLDLATQTAEPRGLAVADPEAAAGALAHILATGDLSKLSNEERVAFYLQRCSSLGLNPLSRPFDWLILDGKLVLYDNKSCAEQLRRQHQISIKITRREIVGDLFVCEGEGRTPNGRTDEATKYVSLMAWDKQAGAMKKLTGNNLANAFAKAESGMKRRLTFSMIGMAAPPDPEEMRGARFVTVDGTGNVLANPTEEQKALAADPTLARVIGEPTYETTGAAADSPLAGQPDQRVRPDELERPKLDRPLATFRPSKEQVTKWRSEYFGAVSGTSYAEDEARHDLVEQWTNGRTGSLMTFLASATERQAAEFIAHARRCADVDRAETGSDSGLSAEATKPEPMTDRGHAAALLTGAPGGFIQSGTELSRPIPGEPYKRADLEAMYAAWVARLYDLDATIKCADVSTIKGTKLFDALQAVINQVDDLEYLLGSPDAAASDEEADTAF